MLNIIYEFSLIIIFFIAFKFYDIYVATATIMVGALLQLLATRFYKGHFEKKQVIVLAILLVFGGMTLYFHDPIFIKWKPTIVFWILGMVFLASQFMGTKTLIQRMLSQAFEGKAMVPEHIWKGLNLAWAMFFLLLGAVNVFIAYYFSTDTWVNFKLYGILSALLLFGFVQSLFLTRYMSSSTEKQL